ncbi:hypothetical protein [Flagellimonas flava]|uniref:hypothetical protein n=1 Tax=Flagellimonas flava TaxID=570519 RepID=UPI003D65E1E3
MKRIIPLVMAMLMAINYVFSQSPGDAAIVAAVSLGHYVENENLKKIRDNEAVIMGLQTTIAVETDAIKRLQEKLYESLSTVQAFINDAQTIREIVRTGDQIGEYQRRMAEIVADDPELLIIALEAEAFLLEQSASLLAEIALAVLGGDANLMNNKERMDLLHHILERMVQLRTMTYSLMRKMEMATGVEIVEALEDLLAIEVDVDWDAINQARRDAITNFVID